MHEHTNVKFTAKLVLNLFGRLGSVRSYYPICVWTCLENQRDRRPKQSTNQLRLEEQILKE